ncbi:MAG: homoserine dehydrogenase [Atopobiaceae bacterium]|jgi:homoserine dehydrogenase|uniref:Homoserine dehydrogenase n=1 Tax=Olsenella absiana TaxID=3115222 RepID=A0ABU7R999_9ACTN|nr:homoserine dehydrogenase [Olsenella sp.]MDY3900145.1 homoserine dehydrogenase [Atopobiaceae bacterium]
MKIAVLGYGTVGRGVVTIVEGRARGVEVEKILDLPKNCTQPRMTPNYDEIVDDPSIEVVVECMGGLEPAHTFICRALRAHKSVVTSNKAVVAEFFDEFAALALENGVGLFIEASVGGGIPWIASIEKARRIDEISSFSGIMNGTTNYIIDSMAKEGLDFDIALGKAQELGYAERDPSADIDGVDVRNKTIISASVAFDVACTKDLPVTGIRTLTKRDMLMFENKGLQVKLFGRGVQRDGSYAVAVEPVAVPRESMEAAVPSNFNLVSLEGATVGPLKFYGQGAGSLPTGNAMVQDVLDAAAGRVPCYDFTRGLAYDPSLLTSNYVYRTTVGAPRDAEWYASGAWMLKHLTAVEARETFSKVLEKDPAAFMAAIAKEA